MSDREKQIAALLAALKFSPDNIILKKHVADLLLEAGRTDEAIQQLREIVKQTADVEAQVSLGKAYYAQGDFQQARAVLEQAQAAQPDGKVALLLSKVFFALGAYQQAGTYYQQALEDDVEDVSYQRELAEKGIQVRARLRVVDIGSARDSDDLLEQPTTTFKDIGGLEDLKENIKMNIIYPFQQPELFKAYGKKVGGGILLYGPPGCGKTFLARATAGECKAQFINIAINDILDMWIGNSEKNLHGVFESARSHTPAIIFIDELDALGGSRQQMRFHHQRVLTNQLLSELDGIDSNNREILVLGATNSPWFVDASLRRPGRFDRVLFVPPPDLKARIEILHIHLREKPVEAIDYVQIAKNTEKFSGADIRAVCEAAADIAIRDAMRTGKVRPIRTGDLLEALKKTKPSTLEWFTTAKNYATYSNTGGLYDDVLDYVKKLK